MTAYYSVRIKLLYTLVIVVSLLQFSCKPDEVTSGSDLIGARNPFDFETKSIDLQCFTTTADSVPTRRLSVYSLGVRNDAILGTTSAQVITQLTIPVNQFSFGPDFTQIDSVVLQLVYNSPTAYYGLQNSTQSFSVYELTEDLIDNPDSQYFSNRSYLFQSTPLGTFSGNFAGMGDSVTVVSNNQIQRLAPHLRIRITNSQFIARLANGESSGIFASNQAFRDAIKGLVVRSEATPTAGQGAIAYINMNNASTALAIYYNGNRSVTFPITVNAIRANKFEHSFSTQVMSQLQPRFSQSFSNTNFLQGLTSLKTRIFIPGLFDLVKDQKIAIVNAELVLKIADGTNVAPFKAPAQIFVQDSDSLGQNQLIRDILENPTYYGGRLDEIKGEYRFNINRHIQYLFNEYVNNNRNMNYGLNLLVPADNPVTAARLILNTEPGNAKLNLTYTVIK
jgi:hypothetical protein